MRQLKITKSITNRESASLDKYLQEIGKEDLITVEEEVELAIDSIIKSENFSIFRLTLQWLATEIFIVEYQNLF